MHINIGIYVSMVHVDLLDNAQLRDGAFLYLSLHIKLTQILRSLYRFFVYIH